MKINVDDTMRNIEDCIAAVVRDPKRSLVSRGGQKPMKTDPLDKTAQPVHPAARL